MNDIKKINSKEKAEMLKSTIYQLYTNEGRSKSYISKLLKINRKTISDKINEWDFPKAKHKRHVNPSTQKFINKHKNLIKSRLDNDIPITKIAEELNVSRCMIQKTIIPADKVLQKAHDDYINRLENNAIENRNKAMEKSYLEYNIEDFPDEKWADILGYSGYQVSNYGRIKYYAKRYKAYHLVKPTPNKNNGRMYVKLYNGTKIKNLQVARLVGHAFVDGYSEKNNTINHNDGNVANNKASNLTWVSQSDNNLHSYRELNRLKIRCKRYNFKKILYKNKYEFKTVAAFAKFLNKSETQTRRYLDNPKKYDIKLIK